MADSDVYLYTPPTYRMQHILKGSLRYGYRVSTCVYRSGGVWHNVIEQGMDAPAITDVDTDTQSGMLLFFTKPMVVPGWLHDGLAALDPADPSWTAGTLTLL